MNTTTRWPVILLALGGGILAASHFGKMPPPFRQLGTTSN